MKARKQRRHHSRPPNQTGLKKLTSPHTAPFQHVTNNAKPKGSGFGRGYGDTPADHDVVDFPKGPLRHYISALEL
jgi:hypothetical protein